VIVLIAVLKRKKNRVAEKKKEESNYS